MDKLKYSISLRAKGLSKNEMVEDMINQGFEESEIDFYIKKSDEIYLNQLLKNKQTSDKEFSNRTVKTVVLIVTFILLLSIFFGYASAGLIGLFLLWSMVKFGSYKR